MKRLRENPVNPLIYLNRGSDKLIFSMPHSQLQTYLTQKLNTTVNELQTVGGGCINQTYKIKTTTGSFFCKTNSASKFPHLFEKEKNGLSLISKHAIIKTPAIIDYNINGDDQILVLEWIEEGTRNNEFWKIFGEQLAALHQSSNEQFGLKENNYMGSVPQS